MKKTTKAHVVVETLDNSTVKEDSGRNAVEDSDREERRSRVRVVTRVHSHADRNTDRRDELQITVSQR